MLGDRPSSSTCAGGSGALRDLAIFLADDGRHALVFCDYTTDDNPPYATLPLDGAITEDQFDAAGIAQFLHEDEVLH